MNNWRTILAWQIRDPGTFETGDSIRMRADVPRDRRTWSSDPTFTIEPGHHGQVMGYPSANEYMIKDGTTNNYADVRWDNYPGPVNASSRGWVVHVEDIELA